MSHTKRHSDFAVEMDSYLKQETKKAESNDEYKPLLEVGRILSKRDYSQHSDKETMYRRILNNQYLYKEGTNRLNRKIWVRFSVTAASLAVAGCISLLAVQPSSASELMGKIINTISLGHISVSQVEPPPEKWTISEEMKKQIMAQKSDQPKKPDPLVVREADQLNAYTSFNVLLPSYQPEGYVFDRAVFYKDGQGAVSNSKYIDIYYINQTTGKQIFMQQRHADHETAFAGSTTHKVDLVKVNNIDAIMTGEHTIDWEANGVLYGITAKGLHKEEILKLAESIRK